MKKFIFKFWARVDKEEKYLILSNGQKVEKGIFNIICIINENDDFENYLKYIPDMIADPKYIVETNKENTAVILKEYNKENERFKLILKIKTRYDPENYKNSVISFWRIGDTTWKKTLKNKKILYMKE